MTTAAANAETWRTSFTSTNTEDLITSSCLLYSDLSTWDLRDMSFENTGDKAGYYSITELGTWNILYFNPCRPLNFDLTYNQDLYDNANVNVYQSLTEVLGEVDHTSFGVY